MWTYDSPLKVEPFFEVKVLQLLIEKLTHFESLINYRKSARMTMRALNHHSIYYKEEKLELRSKISSKNHYSTIIFFQTLLILF